MSAGYSKTPFVKKLGIKSGFRVCLVNELDTYIAQLEDLPSDVVFVAPTDSNIDFIHGFYLSRAQLEQDIDRLKQALAVNGMLWLSWVKKSSKIESDLNREMIREIGLGVGLVDIKVGAIDEIWSGLKFVYRLSDR